MLQTLIQSAVWNPMQAVAMRVINVLPAVIWAVVLVIVGGLVARLIRKGVEKILKMGQIDTWTDKIGLNSLMDHLGLGRSPTKIVGVLVWWFLFLIFFQARENLHPGVVGMHHLAICAKTPQLQIDSQCGVRRRFTAFPHRRFRQRDSSHRLQP